MKELFLGVGWDTDICRLALLTNLESWFVTNSIEGPSEKNETCRNYLCSAHFLKEVCHSTANIPHPAQCMHENWDNTRAKRRSIEFFTRVWRDLVRFFLSKFIVIRNDCHKRPLYRSLGIQIHIRSLRIPQATTDTVASVWVKKYMLP